MVALWPRLICSYRWHHNIMVLLWHVTRRMTLATTGPMMQSLSALLVSVPKRSDYEFTTASTNRLAAKLVQFWRLGHVRLDQFVVVLIGWGIVDHVTRRMTLATTGPMMQSLSALLVSVPKRSDYNLLTTVVGRLHCLGLARLWWSWKSCWVSCPER